MQAIIRTAIKRSARPTSSSITSSRTVRLNGCFGSKDDADERRLVTTAQSAFRRAGWVLSDDGTLMAIGAIDLDTGGRQALDEQLDRLRRSAEDPGQLLGSAKDLLEAVAKFVFEELGCPPVSDFNQLWYLARDRLGVHPRQFVEDAPGAEQVRKILGASWTIAEQVNELRNLQGTGHGRTLPTGVPPDVALLVAREACSLAQFSSVPSTEFWDAQPEKRRARPLRPPTGPHRSHV